MAGPNSTNTKPDLTIRIREHLPDLKRLNEIDAGLNELLRDGANLLRKAGTETTYLISRIPPPVLFGGMAICVTLVSGCVGITGASAIFNPVSHDVHIHGVIDCMKDYVHTHIDSASIGYSGLKNITDNMAPDKLDSVKSVYNYTLSNFGQDGISASPLLHAYQVCDSIPNYDGHGVLDSI
jgi:hypothetical protein